MSRSFDGNGSIFYGKIKQWTKNTIIMVTKLKENFYIAVFLIADAMALGFVWQKNGASDFSGRANVQGMWNGRTIKQRIGVFELMKSIERRKMNNTLSKVARSQIKEKLAVCTEGQQAIFKRMYSHKNLGLSIDKIVDVIPDEKLGWALTQVKNTVKSLMVSNHKSIFSICISLRRPSRGSISLPQH